MLMTTQPTCLNFFIKIVQDWKLTGAYKCINNVLPEHFTCNSILTGFGYDILYISTCVLI